MQYSTRVCYAVSASVFVTLIHFSVTRVESMCSNCLTTTLPVECVCCSWSSLNASPYPGATVCIINVSCYIAKGNTICIKKKYFSLQLNGGEISHI